MRGGHGKKVKRALVRQTLAANGAHNTENEGKLSLGLEKVGGT